VVYFYGNYAGDVLNFDRAAAMAADQHGIRVVTVLGTDDVASAPPAEATCRRGIAGAFLVLKCAGAKAELGADLDAVVAATRKANANTRTMGVALSSCTVPANGKPTFSLGAEEMEIGLGIHGEPGMRRAKLEPVDAIVDQMVETILADLDFAGSDVAVLVNGLGATPYEELYVVFRRVRQILDARNVRIRHRFVGEYVKQPANCPMFKQF
jgi:dihydroxyacetone kinase-like protein